MQKGLDNMAKKDEKEKPYKNKVRLDSPGAVLRLLGRVSNLVLDDKITTDKARCIGYLAGVMMKGFEVTEIEERLLKLEEAANKEVGK